MKSEAVVLKDYREVPFDGTVALKDPERYAAKKLRVLVKGRRHAVKPDTVETGDVAVLKLSSDLPKFNREKVVITVSGNLFDEDLEAELIGKQKGESFTFRKENEDVSVTILDLTRYVYPEVDDAMVEEYTKGSDELPEMHSVEEYRKYLLYAYEEEKKAEVMNSAMQEVYNAVLAESEWNLADEDVEGFFNGFKDEIEEETGKKFEELTDEQIARFGVKGKEELEAMMKSQAEESVKNLLWLSDVYGVSADEVMQDEEGKYGFGFLEEYIENGLKIVREEN